MRPRGLISPPRSRFSLTDSDSHNNGAAATPPSVPNYMSPTRRSTAATVANPKQQRITHTKPSPKPAASVVPSRRRPTWAPNPNDQKKLSPSPRTQRRNSNSSGPGPTPISKNSSPKPVGAVASGSSYGSGHHQDVKNNNTEAEVDHYTKMIGYPHVYNQLEQLSIDVGSNLVLLKQESFPKRNNATRIFQIYKDIASHRQGNSSITSYFTMLKTLWDELETYDDLPQCCSYGSKEKLSKLVEREKIMQFLVGLNDSYSTIGSQILLIRPFPTVEKAYSIIIQEEKQRNMVLSSEIVADKVMQNKWLHHNDQINDDNGIEQVISRNGSGPMMSVSLYNPDKPREEICRTSTY